MRKVGNRVTRLERRRIANVKLGGLAPGAWRHLTAAERSKLLKMVTRPHEGMNP